MSPEPVTPLAAAARRRHQQATERARTALRQFEASGQPVTYAAVATAAQVSRAWLYTQPDIRAAADQLRRINGRSSNVPVPTMQRTSESSLVRRLEAAHDRSRQLSGEVAELRQQLAVAHANLREARRHIPQVSAK